MLNPPSPWLAMRPRAATRALGISECLLWALTATHDSSIPHFRLGKSILYLVDELRRWLTAQAKKKEAPMTSNPFKDLIDKLYRMIALAAKRNGKGHVSLCPCDDDHKPSLSIAEGNDGWEPVKCHAGCTVGDIFDAEGLRVSDLIPN